MVCMFHLWLLTWLHWLRWACTVTLSTSFIAASTSFLHAKRKNEFGMKPTYLAKMSQVSVIVALWWYDDCEKHCCHLHKIACQHQHMQYVWDAGRMSGENLIGHAAIVWYDLGSLKYVVCDAFSDAQWWLQRVLFYLRVWCFNEAESSIVTFFSGDKTCMTCLWHIFQWTDFVEICVIRVKTQLMRKHKPDN